MTRYGSVLGLAARSTFWRVLGVTLASCGLEAALFLLTLANWQSTLYGPEGSWETPNPMSLEELIAHSHIALCFGVGLAAAAAVLAFLGWEGSGCRTGYTLRRLRVGEKRLALLWGGYGTACLVIYWAFHLATVLALCAAALPALPGEYRSPQTLFLACWRSPYLHALLPLADWWLLGRNLLLCAGLGFGGAYFSYRRRHGLRAWGWIPLALAAALFFPLPMGAAGVGELDPAFLAYWTDRNIQTITPYTRVTPLPSLLALGLTVGGGGVLLRALAGICGRDRYEP